MHRTKLIKEKQDVRGRKQRCMIDAGYVKISIGPSPENKKMIKLKG